MFGKKIASEQEKSEEMKRKEREDARLAAEIQADFESRQQARRTTESTWLLNMNFFSGNQYCDVSPYGGIEQEDKQFFWQSRRVFNHIAPTVDARLAKLEKMRPSLRVRAFSDEDGDLKAAKLATGILSYAQERIAFGQTVSNATMWSEVCGSAFYKIAWDEKAGKQVCVDENGEAVYEGEVRVDAVSPFEIFPDRMNAEGLEDIDSLIHAKVVSVDYIFEKFGVALQGQEISDLTLMGYSEPSAGKILSQNAGESSTVFHKAEILIERYTRPSVENKDGKLEIVAGGKLL